MCPTEMFSGPAILVTPGSFVGFPWFLGLFLFPPARTESGRSPPDARPQRADGARQRYETLFHSILQIHVGTPALSPLIRTF